MMSDTQLKTTTAAVPGFPRYTFTEDGRVFKDELSKAVSCKKGKAAQIIIRENKRMYTFGFAKLVAGAFVDNPNNYSRVIFKDGNNHNCTKNNLLWVDVSTWGFFNRTKKLNYQPLKKLRSAKPLLPPIDISKFRPLANLSGYLISPEAVIVNGLRIKKAFYKKSFKVNINGKEYSIAKLLALTYIPNPNNYKFFIFKDKNNRNCVVENIAWVSGRDYLFWTMGDKRKKSFKVHVVKEKHRIEKKPTKLPWWQLRPPLNNVKICELHDYDLSGYFITSDGLVYKGSKRLAVNPKGKKARILKIQKNGRKYYFGLAKLIARHFVPNPARRNHVIFKDRNNLNCNANNLAWVDGETFLEYSCGPTWKNGCKKIVLERDYAFNHCVDIFLKAYYKTLDEQLLLEYWQRISEDYSKFIWWEKIESECFIYFLDRAKRFSILVPAGKMLWYYAKGQRLKLQNEISPDMSRYQASKVDETLRDRVNRSYYDTGSINDTW